MFRQFGRRLENIGDALSQLANVAFLPKPFETDANESISGRAHRRRWVRVERWIDRVAGREHCRKAFAKDVRRARRLLNLDCVTGDRR